MVLFVSLYFQEKQERFCDNFQKITPKNYIKKMIKNTIKNLTKISGGV